MIYVVAIITAKPGQREKILEAARANIPAVLAEDGCIEYAPTVDAEGLGSFQTKFGDDTFVFVEKWRDAGAQGTRGGAAHGCVWRQGKRSDRESCHSRALAHVVKSTSPHPYPSPAFAGRGKQFSAAS